MSRVMIAKCEAASRAAGKPATAPTAAETTGTVSSSARDRDEAMLGVGGLAARVLAPGAAAPRTLPPPPSRKRTSGRRILEREVLREDALPEPGRRGRAALLREVLASDDAEPTVEARDSEDVVRAAKRDELARVVGLRVPREWSHLAKGPDVGERGRSARGWSAVRLRAVARPLRRRRARVRAAPLLDLADLALPAHGRPVRTLQAAMTSRTAAEPMPPPAHMLDDAEAAAAPPQLVDHRDDHARAGAGDRVAEAASAAVHVHDLVVEPEDPRSTRLPSRRTPR